MYCDALSRIQRPYDLLSLWGEYLIIQLILSWISVVETLWLIVNFPKEFQTTKQLWIVRYFDVSWYTIHFYIFQCKRKVKLHKRLLNSVLQGIMLCLLHSSTLRIRKSNTWKLSTVENSIFNNSKWYRLLH